MTKDMSNASRRALLAGSVGIAAAAAVVSAVDIAPKNPTPAAARKASGFVTTTDGVEIFYKDWGLGQPIVFSHGWPLSADDWDPNMMFFLSHGYRVIAHDRRGHGRSTQTDTGNDMDQYAADLAAMTAHLGVTNAIHVGYSTGGGEVVHYAARHQERWGELYASTSPPCRKRRIG